MEGKTFTRSSGKSVIDNPERAPQSIADRFTEKLTQLPPEQAKLFEELVRYESEHINHNFSDSFKHLKLMPIRATPCIRVGSTRLRWQTKGN